MQYRSHMKCRRNLLGLSAGLVAISITRPARSDIVSDLLQKTAENKELNDRKRAATSYANFARSRTVSDGTCAFPDNFIGCQNAAELGNVKFLTEDLKIECQGSGKSCASKSKGNLPSFMGV